MILSYSMDCLVFKLRNNVWEISPIDIIMISITVGTSFLVIVLTTANGGEFLVFSDESDGLEFSSDMGIITKRLVFRKTTRTVFVLFPRF